MVARMIVALLMAIEILSADLFAQNINPITKSGSEVAPRRRSHARSAPPPARAPFDAQQAKAYQMAWARHLGTTVEATNSLGMKMVLIPPGKFIDRKSVV